MGALPQRCRGSSVTGSFQSLAIPEVENQRTDPRTKRSAYINVVPQSLYHGMKVVPHPYTQPVSSILQLLGKQIVTWCLCPAKWLGEGSPRKACCFRRTAVRALYAEKAAWRRTLHGWHRCKYSYGKHNYMYKILYMCVIVYIYIHIISR